MKTNFVFLFSIDPLVWNGPFPAHVKLINTDARQVWHGGDQACSQWFAETVWGVQNREEKRWNVRKIAVVQQTQSCQQNRDVLRCPCDQVCGIPIVSLHFLIQLNVKPLLQTVHKINEKIPFIIHYVCSQSWYISLSAGEPCLQTHSSNCNNNGVSKFWLSNDLLWRKLTLALWQESCLSVHLTVYLGLYLLSLKNRRLNERLDKLQDENTEVQGQNARLTSQVRKVT